MSFFDLAPAAIDTAALDAFLAERLPESLNLDYKRELNERVFEAVAALANSYGGIVLVGVAEDPADPARPLLPPVGVDPDDRERFVNQAFTRFQPPFAPDVVPVPLPNGRVVLVIRVDPRRAERPIVLTRKDDNRVLVRLDTRNATADRYRLAALFREGPVDPAAAATPGNWRLRDVGPYPIDDRDRPALTARVAVEARIPYERLDRAMITTPDRGVLAAAMEHSPLSNWLSLQVGQYADTWDSSTWRESGAYPGSRSWGCVLRWRASFAGGAPAPVGGQVVLLLPSGMTAFGGRLTMLVDASFDPEEMRFSRPDGQLSPRARLRIDDLYSLLLALLATALDVAAPAVFPRILDVPMWERLGPTAYLNTYTGPQSDTGLGHFLGVDRYHSGGSLHLELPMAEFFVPRSLEVEDEASRSELVKEWLSRLLLDMGLAHFEDDLAKL